MTQQPAPKMPEDPPVGKGKEPFFPVPRFMPRTSDLETLMEEVRSGNATLGERIDQGFEKMASQGQDRVNRPKDDKPAQLKAATPTPWDNPAWTESNQPGYGQTRVEQLQQGHIWPKPIIVPPGIVETPPDIYVPKWKLTDIGVFWPDVSEEKSGNNEVFTDGTQVVFTDVALWLGAVHDVVVLGSQERSEYVRMNLW